MCRSGWCTRYAVQFVVQMLEAADAGEPVDEVLCAGLGDLLDATAAAYIRFDLTEHTCTMTCWPYTVDLLRLKAIVEHLPRAFPLLVLEIARSREPRCLSAAVEPQEWRGSVIDLLLWEVLGVHELAHLPLHTGDSELRMVVLARRKEFALREMHLLQVIQRPSAALESLMLRVGSSSRGAVGSASQGAADPHGLTARELEVLGFLAQGMLARTIASRMDVSARTVHKHLANVYRKLDAHDRLLAVARAQAFGLIPQQRGPSDAPADGGISTHGGPRPASLASERGESLS